MVDDYGIVWLDLTYTSVSRYESVRTHSALSKIDPYLVVFRDPDQCIDYITDSATNQVMLMITYQRSICSPDNVLLQLSRDLSEIHSLYIIYVSEEQNDNLTEGSSKIHRIYKAEIQPLYDHLAQLPSFKQRRQHRREAFTGNDLTFTTLSSGSAHSTNDFNNVAASVPITTDLSNSQQNDAFRSEETVFLHGQILRDILVRQESTREQMIDYCRKKYVDSRSYLNAIDEFEAYYDECHAIYWYTRDTFLYRLLNKALREHDTRVLYSVRYFIKDLHWRLARKYIEQYIAVIACVNEITSLADIKTVYRGQLMTKNEFESKIQYNIGGFFLVNSFFSTTTNERLACVFAGDGSHVAEYSVLFKIDVDWSLKAFEYANITTESVFDQSENEILFSMGAVFQILSIDSSEPGLWKVHLQLTAKKNEEFKELIERMRRPAFDRHPLYDWANLMLTMGIYTQAKESYFLMLEDENVTSNFKLMFSIYKQLGLLNRKVGLYQETIDYFEKSLEIRLNHFPSDDSFLAFLYQNLGSAYLNAGDGEKALVCYDKTLQMALSKTNPDRTELASIYNNIGNVHKQQQNFEKALEMFQNAFRKQLAVLSDIDRSLTTCDNIFLRANACPSYYTNAVEYLKNITLIRLSCVRTNQTLANGTEQNIPSALSGYKSMKLVLDSMKTSYDARRKELIS